VGENAMLGIAAAIGNAIYNAIGVEVHELPMTPERVWRAIKEQRPELLEGW
jgi:CO/xanthine dehydrogenase Mo-binding subunit